MRRTPFTVLANNALSCQDHCKIKARSKQGQSTVSIRLVRSLVVQQIAQKIEVWRTYVADRRCQGLGYPHCPAPSARKKAYCPSALALYHHFDSMRPHWIGRFHFAWWSLYAASSIEWSRRLSRPEAAPRAMARIPNVTFESVNQGLQICSEIS